MAFIISFEGVDGSGKTTQIQMLADKLLNRGKEVAIRSYPVYGSFFGKELGKLLLGSDPNFKASVLDPKSMALWYALDRWLDHKNNVELFSGDGFLLLNRYTMSSIVYQSLRDNNPDVSMRWVDELEHSILGLPRPHLYIVLDVIPEITSTNVISKGKRLYIGEGKADVYENDIALQKRARGLYLDLAERSETIKVVRCYEGDKMLSQILIHERIMEVLDAMGLLE